MRRTLGKVRVVSQPAEGAPTGFGLVQLREAARGFVTVSLSTNVEGVVAIVPPAVVIMPGKRESAEFEIFVEPDSHRDEGYLYGVIDIHHLEPDYLQIGGGATVPTVPIGSVKLPNTTLLANRTMDGCTVVVEDGITGMLIDLTASPSSVTINPAQVRVRDEDTRETTPFSITAGVNPGPVNIIAIRNGSEIGSERLEITAAT